MSRRLTIIFIVIILIAAVIILSSPVFSVKEINTTYPLTDKFTSQDIISSVNSLYNKNIFTVSESKASALIEKAVPYVKVLDIERKFPNQVLIKTTLRVGIIVLPVTNTNDFIIIDEELKILERVDADNIDISQYTVADGLAFVASSDDISGNYINYADNDFALLIRIIRAIKGFNSTLHGEAFIEFIKIIDFNYEGVIRITVFTDQLIWDDIRRDKIEEDLQEFLSVF